MKITYYEETDSAVIVLREPGSDTVGEIAGEGLVNLETDEEVPGIVLHRDDAGELYEIEIYSGASRRLDLGEIRLRRVPLHSGPVEASASVATSEATSQ